MEGGDLLQYLNKVKKTNAEIHAKEPLLTEEQAKHVFYQILTAISHAHNQHICHRDLKLENILYVLTFFLHVHLII